MANLGSLGRDAPHDDFTSQIKKGDRLSIRSPFSFFRAFIRINPYASVVPFRIYGTRALTSVEKALSLLLESTDVTTKK